ncbi:MAG TPA: type VI secretion system tube protein Hcp [Bryobacteraceae bacterium]
MFSTFVNFGDIKGEATEKDHKDWVMATKVEFEVVQPPSSTQQTAGGRSAEAVEFSEFKIQKLVDKASPKLFEASCKGTHIPEVVVDYIRASGDSAIKYLEIKLKEVLISGITHLADPKAEHQFPSEEIRMTFGAIEKTYTQQKPDGKAGGNVAAKWSVSKGAAA